jgi:hypothetical protein
MPKDKPSFADLAHQVVRESPEPLPFDEILRRVNTLAPITTKNPKQTIRQAVGQSRLIVATGDGRYGWKPRLIIGSVLRLTLSASDLGGRAVEFDEDLRDALWPAFFEIQKRSDRSPVNVRLPDGSTAQLPLDFLGKGHWGTTGSPDFWAWLKTLNAAPGDHLIFRVLDGDAKLHAVEFQPRAARDEAAIAARNQAIIQAALAFIRKRPYGAAQWDISSHLLATGQYRHPVPPDPLSEIWTPEVWQPEIEGKNAASWMLVGGVVAEPAMTDMFASLLGGADRDYDAPRDLPREYQPGGNRRPRPSRQAGRGAVKTYTLRVNHRALPDVWRDIEIAEDQTLEDLHLAIQGAYGWGDDHLYSFFMSGHPQDQRTEIGSPWSETRRHTHQVEIGSLNVKPGDRFLYFFDYGDSHEFDVRVLHVNPAASKGAYPRVVAQQGKPPPQYPDYDEETGEPDWDPYQR